MEVLTFVFNFSEPEKIRYDGHGTTRPSTHRTLHALSLACRTISPVASELLLHDITFVVKEDDEDIRDNGFQQIMYFLRTCYEKPAVVQHVRSIWLTWHRHEPYFLHALLQHLNRCTSLERLNLGDPRRVTFALASLIPEMISMAFNIQFHPTTG